VAENICTVVVNDWINDLYKHLVLDAPPAALGAAPGQFFHQLCPATGGGTPSLRRPMSVYRIDRDNGRVELLYKVLGPGIRGIATLVSGTPFDIIGPVEIGFTLDPAWRHIVVLGRGVGLATLAPLAQAAQERGISLAAIPSARNPGYVMSIDLFEADGAEVIALTDSEGTSAVETVETIMERLIAERRADAFFTCGSNRLFMLMQRLGAKHGVPGQVALEQQMACALCMCRCCVRPIRAGDHVVHERVCWDGPVFDLQTVISW
jgi:dihydroorotate dehydrogenase electron transfer subunit